MSWIMNQSMKKLIISVNMHYLLFFKRYIQRKLTLEETPTELAPNSKRA